MALNDFKAILVYIVSSKTNEGYIMRSYFKRGVGREERKVVVMMMMMMKKKPGKWMEQERKK